MTAPHNIYNFAPPNTPTPQTMNPPTTTYNIVQRLALIADVNTHLNRFETDVTELERLWLIHDKHRTTDPIMFEISVSLWRTRKQSLQDRLGVYWSAEDSRGHAWLTYSQEKEILDPDSLVGTTNITFRAKYNDLVERCEKLGFLDFLQVGVLSGIGE